MSTQPFSCPLQIGQRTRFTAETERINLQLLQAKNRSIGKNRRTVAGPWERELNQQVNTGIKSHPGSEPFIKKSRFAALQKMSAHHRHTDIGFGLQSALLQMIEMTIVKRIIFRNQPYRFHGNTTGSSRASLTDSGVTAV